MHLLIYLASARWLLLLLILILIVGIADYFIRTAPLIGDPYKVAVIVVLTTLWPQLRPYAP